MRGLMVITRKDGERLGNGLALRQAHKKLPGKGDI
jgi:hypothetical protein